MKKLLFCLLIIFICHIHFSVLYSQNLDSCIELFSKQKTEECLSCLNNYIKLKPGDTIAYLHRANINNNLHKYEDASTDLSAYLSLTDNFKVRTKRGYTYFMLNNYDKALEDFNSAININSKDDRAYMWRGIIYYFLNKYNEAIGDFNKALELFPETKTPLLYRGLTNKKLGLTDEANKDFNDAIKYLNSITNRDNAYFNLYQTAIAYCGLGDTKKALENWEEGKKFCSFAESDFERFFECK